MLKQNNWIFQKSKIFHAIEKSWCRKSCYPPQRDQWTKQNPSLGQCAVTALIVHDFLGGKICYNSQFKHYWNLLPNDEIVDLTKSQFNINSEIKFEKFINRDYLLESNRAIEAQTLSRYKTFKKKVLEKLKLNV